MKREKYYEILDKLRTIIIDTEWENHVFAVGGCVRDCIMNNEINDIDLVVDLCNGGINFAKWLEKNNYITGSIVIYENFGTAMFHLKDFPDVEIEVVHTRKECYHDAKTRNPETSFGTIEEDATRRDFTINAFYYNICNGLTFDITDKGMNDIQNEIIRTCGKPEIIYDEDSLRILRMVKIASRFNFEIEDETFKCAKLFVDRLSIVSKERITDEFTKMITYNKDMLIKSLCGLYDIGAFKYIIPEFSNFGLFTWYTLISNIKDDLPDNPSIELVLAKLLYYVKDYPHEFKTKNDYIRYVLQTILRYSNNVVNEVIFLTEMNEKLHKICTDICVSLYENFYKVREIMNKCGSKKDFYNAVICGSERVFYEFLNCDYGNTLFDELDEKYSMFYDYKLPVDGNDVMETFNIEPSSKVKELLNKIFMFVCVNPDKNTREDCLNYVKYMKKTENLW